MRRPCTFRSLVGLPTLAFLTALVHAHTFSLSRGAPPPLADASPATLRNALQAGMAAGAAAGNLRRPVLDTREHNGASASSRGGGAPREDEYVGSAACQRCHESAYDTWRRTLHVQMTKPIAEARVEGDFGFSYGSRGPTPARERSGRADAPSAPAAGAAVRFESYGRAYTMETRDGRYFISISNNKRPAEKF